MKKKIALTNLIKFVTTIVIVGFNSLPLSAQIKFNLFTKDDGLLTNEVTCTYRDKRGFVWIGTKAGLQVYNGKYFRSIKHQILDSNSLSGDWVLAITEDSAGFIWVGTDKGITKVHPGHLRCTRFVPGINLPDGINTGFSTVASDFRGRVWALTSNYLLCNVNDSLICTDKVSTHGTIRCTSNDELLITTFNRVIIKNLKTGEITEAENFSGEVVNFTCAFKDALGNFWMGTWGDGIILYDRNWKIKQTFKWDNNPANPGTTNIVGAIESDAEHVFVGTTNGLYIYDLKRPIKLDNPLQILRYQSDVEHGISSGIISHIMVDNQTNVWISTSSGLNVSMALNGYYTRIVNEIGFTTDIGWLDSNLVTTSWYGKGMYFFNRKMQVSKVQKYFPEYSNLVNNSQISGFDMDKDGTMWVATFNGLVHYNWLKQHTINYYTREKDGLATNRLNDVWVNPLNHEIWLANYDEGISRLNTTTGNVTQHNLKNSSFIHADLVWRFYDDKRATLWVLTNYGISRYNYKNETWASWTEIIVKGHKAEFGTCRSILTDSRGIVWLGTENGLFVYINSTWSFYSTENGLPEKEVNSICEDKKGNIWLSLDNSIVHFDILTKSTFVLSANSDILLPHADMAFIDPTSDQLYLVAMNSIYKLDKESILATHTPSPAVYLESFLINGVSYYSSTNGFGLDKRDFSYDQNNIEISFVTPFIGEVGSLLYSYRIGEQGAWSVADENTRISLPKLRPGSYRLEIRATTDGTHWSKKPLILTFHIHPPFWSTWWFRLGVAGFVLSIIVWLVRFISTKNLRFRILQLEKLQAIEMERSRLSRDMHDDLGSGLTKISILSEVVMKKIDGKENVDSYLENISLSSRELVQNLNNIIWALNPGNDGLQALVAYIREYATQFLESCQVDSEIDAVLIPNNIMVSEQVKRSIFLVVKESLNNAVKYGKASKIILSINIYPGRQINICIKDNGVGFDMGAVLRGNGLKNMERRMMEIGGEIKIMSEAGKGTEVKVSYKF